MTTAGHVEDEREAMDDEGEGRVSFRFLLLLAVAVALVYVLLVAAFGSQPTDVAPASTTPGPATPTALVAVRPL